MLQAKAWLSAARRGVLVALVFSAVACGSSSLPVASGTGGGAGPGTGGSGAGGAATGGDRGTGGTGTGGSGAGGASTGGAGGTAAGGHGQAGAGGHGQAGAGGGAGQQNIACGGGAPCGPGQICVHPNCAGGALFCMARPDGGTCPTGWVQASFCPQLSGGGCTPAPCTPPAPYCADIPAACNGTPSCACLPYDLCTKTGGIGSCVQASPTDLRCAAA